MGEIVNKKQIKAIMAYNGLTVEKIAEMCRPRVTPCAVSLTINGKRRNPALCRAIADILRVPAELLFPHLQDPAQAHRIGRAWKPERAAA